MKTLSENTALDDEQLVELCLTGNRDAFGRVVARYQSLICGIAYSACGDVGRSEDLAQDTFIAAWKDLGALKEPGKLKGWLCGIIRNLINNSHRRESRTPTAQADLLDGELPSSCAGPDEQAMSKEEEAIVWRALETIPAGYREPMVLFYRKGQSTQAVATALDLTEETVRQRLSRGRVMLNESVAQTVESALSHSAPGKAFTIAVLAALPGIGIGISAKAATVGATAVSGSATAKAAASAGWLGAFLSPVLAFLSIWIGYRMEVDASQPGRERAFIKGTYRSLFWCLTAFFVTYIVLMCFAQRLMETHAGLLAALLIGLALAYVVAIAVFSYRSMRRRNELMATMTSEELAGTITSPAWEYRSKLHFLGLPLVHIRIGGRLAAPVKAWIAAGDCAFGGLFAFGGMAIAPVSIGGCAVGLLSFGGLSIGSLALGGLVLGIWSFGGMVLGWQSFGGCALAWDAAFGGVALARDFALGGMAHATQANNDAAVAHLEACTFIRGARAAVPYLVWMNLLWFLPMLAWWRVMARRGKKAAAL